MVPALGTGEPRPLAVGGRSPRYSPDGTQIAFWRGELHNTAGRIFLIPAVGGEVKELDVRGQFPIWSPDGRRLMFRSVGSFQSNDWLVAALDGGPPTAVGMTEVFRRLKVGRPPPPASWIGNHIVFSAVIGDNENLWRIRLSPGAFKVASEPERVTFGSGSERQPSFSQTGQMVFSSLSLNANLWTIPFDPQTSKVTGAPVQLTSDTSMEFEPSLSADGKLLVFTSTRAGNSDIWMRDMESGRQVPVAASPQTERLAVISSDGSKVAYSLGTSSVGMVRIARGQFNAPEKLCDLCNTPYSWSGDGRFVAVFRPGSREVSVLDTGGGKSWIALRRLIQFFQWSPDGGHVSFHVSLPDSRQVYVTPFRMGQELAPESEWIGIFDGKGMDREATWSPDGTTLFFYSERDGYRCIWGQRLEKTTKRPVGDAFEIFHAHGSRSSLSELPDNLWSKPAFAKDKIVVSLGEKSGSVWIADLGQAPSRW